MAMKARQKQIVYDLLKTASIYIQGFPLRRLSAPTPAFSDDIVPIPNITQTAQNATFNTAPNACAVNITMQDLKAVVASCKKCSLCATKKNIVIGEGVKNPLVLVIGEAPGAKEDETGRPFVGDAGILLDKMLSSIHLSRKTNCYIANIIKCRPPQNRTPEPNECLACFPYLQTQIQILKPKALLAMGRVAAQTLLKTSLGISFIRGKVQEYNGLPLVATYHPSALLRNTELKKGAWQDLKTFAYMLRQEALI